MSYIQEFEFEFHVGDVFDVTPLEGSYVIGMILSLGGECYVDGNKIVVSSMPNQTAPAPAPEPVAVEPTLKPDPEEGPIVPVIVHVTPDELEEIEFVEVAPPNPEPKTIVEEAFKTVVEVLDTVQAELEPPLEEEAPPVVKAAPIKRPRTPKIVVKEEIE